jgi:transcriptional regulator with XRE-family HTH domain
MENSEQTARLEMARRLRASRLERGLSQAELAEVTGISRVAVSEIESGRRKVGSLELATLSRVLGQPPDYFLGTSSADEEHAGTRTINHLARTARKLAPSDQEQLLRFAEYLRHESQRRGGARE